MKSKMTPFSSVLIANRGEIALRIMRTAKAAGLRTIAVYTKADAAADHVLFADEAALIGVGPVGESYLSIEKLLDAARETGAEAIHPGYGFLSESADFANAVTKAGLIFVGPSAQAIEAMGNKASAKRLMIAASVPCVPGYEEADQSEAAMIAAADRIGFPIMVKAAAGGGGRGMRLVHEAADLPSALGLARSESLNAFGSGELILEKAIARPRHIEVQVFADRSGATIHLGERDCSIQRRHQKVIEEAPSPVVSADLRARMGQAAINAAKAVAYEGAGTVEFLLDETGEFYFLEMNTRLQVEHPVTELVAGLDLVALQFEVAAGHPLPVSQEDISLTGHAIEARLYAEDPENDFLPSSGEITHWQEPNGDGLRVDSGIRQGQSVSPFYDPMLAKIIAYGCTRDEARKRLIAGLAQAPLFGPKTNRDFLINLLGQDGFAAGDATTAFIAETYGATGPTGLQVPFTKVAMAAALNFRDLQSTASAASRSAPALLGWGSPGGLKSRMKLGLGENVYDLRLSLDRDGNLEIRAAEGTATARFERETLRIDGRKQNVVAVQRCGDVLHIADTTNGLTFRLIRSASGMEDGSDGSRVFAPMHGNIIKVFVSPDDTVRKGTRLAVLEAMKMQHEIVAEADGHIASVSCNQGQQVSAGDLLLEIDLDDGEMK